jgi:hypothetical protein
LAQRIEHDDDGFVIYDFLGFTGFSFNSGAHPIGIGAFTESSTLTSNTLNQSATVDVVSGATSSADGFAFDNPLIPNFVFSFPDMPPAYGSDSATLTIHSSILGSNIARSVAGAVDGGSGFFAFSTNEIEVPLAVAPEPPALTLLGLSALSFLVFSQRVARSSSNFG